MDVNLCESLRAIMDTNTAFYKTDFDYDVDILRKVAKGTFDDDKTLLWYSRPSGTFCDTERQVFQKDTSGHNGWIYYAEQHPSDRILAYSAEITSIDMKTGNVYGNLFELDYQKYVSLVKEKAISTSEVSIYFVNGDYERMSLEGFRDINFMNMPRIHNTRNEPDNQDSLGMILKNSKIIRENTGVEGNFENHISRLNEGRITFEANRIVAAINKVKVPNSSDKNSFMTDIPPHFNIINRDDIEKLKEALPYKSITICSFRDRRGMYAVVDAKEIMQSRQTQEKPSITALLKANQHSSSNNKSAPKKNNNLEV